MRDLLRHWGCRLGGLGGMVMLLNLHPSSLPGQSPHRELRQVHLGMEVRIVAHHADSARIDAGIDAAFAEIARLEQILSDWRPTSELSRLTDEAADKWTVVSRELFEVIDKAVAVARATDGAFDPTIGALTRLWREARRTGQPAPDSVIRLALATVDYRRIHLDSSRTAVRIDGAEVRLDVGGIAKGWILGRASKVLAAHGLTVTLIEAGGDVVAGDRPPGESGWRIAVRDGDGERVIEVRNGAVATSGPTAQSIVEPDGTQRSHVIDPRRGLGISNGIEVTVTGRDPAFTDAVATALTVLPEERWEAVLRTFGVKLVGVHRSR